MANSGRLPSRIGSAAIALAASAVFGAPLAAAQLVKKHGDWSAYQHEEDGRRLCFLVAQPKDKQPAGARRDLPHFYVSAWPQAGVQAEVSIKMGYPVKSGSDTIVKIDDQTFRLFAEADRGFVGDPAEEAKLIEAMKKGQRMSVAATSERGTATTDTYSLAGIAQGLQALRDCK